jgi:hypothetical protein
MERTWRESRDIRFAARVARTAYSVGRCGTERPRSLPRSTALVMAVNPNRSIGLSSHDFAESPTFSLAPKHLRNAGGL